jgi:hypothetical protein
VNVRIQGAGQNEEIIGIDDLFGLRVTMADYFSLIDGEGDFLFTGGKDNRSAAN